MIIDELKEVLYQLDIQYILYYVLIMVISLFLLLGFQNIVHNTIPQWNVWYFALDFIILIMSFVSIIFIIFRKRDYDFKFQIWFFAIFISMTIIQITLLWGFHYNDDMMFRTAFYIIGAWAFYNRIQYNKICIRTGL